MSYSYNDCKIQLSEVITYNTATIIIVRIYECPEGDIYSTLTSFMHIHNLHWQIRNESTFKLLVMGVGSQGAGAPQCLL